MPNAKRPMPTALRHIATSSLFLLIIGMPFHEVIVRLLPGSGIWDEVVLLLLLICLVPWFRSVLRGEEKLPRFFVPMLAFLCVTLLSAAVNHLSVKQTVFGLHGMHQYMIGGIAAYAFIRGETVQRLLKAMFVVATITAVYGIASFLTFRAVGGQAGLPSVARNAWEAVALWPWFHSSWNQWRLFGTFMNENYYGDWLAMMVPIGLVMALNTRHGVPRWAGLASVVTNMVAFTWSYSRGAALAMTGSLAVASWRVSPWGLLLLAPIILTGPMMATDADVERFTDIAATEGGRLHSVRKTFRSFRTHPFLGHGPNTRGLADMNYAKIGYETGLLGLGTFGWLVISCVIPVVVRTKKTRGPCLSGAVLAAMVAMCLAAVGGEVWEIPQLAHYFWILAGLLSCIVSLEKARVVG